MVSGVQAIEPTLDVLTRWARGIARGQKVDVNRTFASNWPGSRAPMQQVGQGRDISEGRDER